MKPGGACFRSERERERDRLGSPATGVLFFDVSHACAPRRLDMLLISVVIFSLCEIRVGQANSPKNG